MHYQGLNIVPQLNGEITVLVKGPIEWYRALRFGAYPHHDVFLVELVHEPFEHLYFVGII